MVEKLQTQLHQLGISSSFFDGLKNGGNGLTRSVGRREEEIAVIFHFVHEAAASNDILRWEKSRARKSLFSHETFMNENLFLLKCSG
jgi:hypothetical protein